MSRWPVGIERSLHRIHARVQAADSTFSGQSCVEFSVATLVTNPNSALSVLSCDLLDRYVVHVCCYQTPEGIHPRMQDVACSI